MGTVAPMVDPAHPGVAAAIMGNTASVLEEHYNRANSAFAAQSYHATLFREREKTKGMAEREFRAGSVTVGVDLNSANSGNRDV